MTQTKVWDCVPILVHANLRAVKLTWLWISASFVNWFDSICSLILFSILLGLSSTLSVGVFEPGKIKHRARWLLSLIGYDLGAGLNQCTLNELPGATAGIFRFARLFHFALL